MTPRTLALGDAPGRGIVVASWVCFAIVAIVVVPLALGLDALESTVVIVSLLSFGFGFLLWIVAFFAALARTARGDDIAVSTWVFLAGSAPTAVRNNLMLAAGLTLGLAVATTGVSPFVWLTNLLPLAFAAWWGARHGTFPPRPQRPGPPGPRGSDRGGVQRGRSGK